MNATPAHQVDVKCCPGCQAINRGAFPPDVNSLGQYGAHLKGLMVYLLDSQLLPSARAAELLSDGGQSGTERGSRTA